MSHYDENLNDVADVMIEDLERKNRTLMLVSRGVTVLCILLAILLASLAATTHKQIQELTDAKDEALGLYDDCVDSIATQATFLELVGYEYLHRDEVVPLNDSTFLAFATKAEAYYPDILLAHAHLECGMTFSSGLAQNANNLFGMKKPHKRKHLQNGTYNGYGSYDSWRLCVLCRIWWNRVFFKNKKPTREEYYQSFLVYAEDPNYISKLKRLCGDE